MVLRRYGVLLAATLVAASGALSACRQDNMMTTTNQTGQDLVIYRDATAVSPNATPAPVQTIQAGRSAPVFLGSMECVQWAFEARTVSGDIVARRPAPACPTDEWTITGGN
jgi:hypothetical protein